MTNAATLASLAASGALSADSSGNVGIGTSSPTVKLDVQTSADASINVQSTGTIQSAFVRIVGRQASSNEEWNIVSAGSGLGSPALRFVRGTWTNTPAALIDSGGNLIIGKTTTDINTIGWSLIKGVGSNYVFDMGGTTNECFNYNNTGTGTYDIAFRYQGATKGYIRTTSTTVSFTNLSDYRLKENVQPMTGALAKVAALKPCTYTWKENGFAGQGFIAHELAEVVPDAVTGEKDAVNEDGSIKPQGIDTSFLVATLTAAIQELKAEVDQLRAQLEAK